MNNLNITFLILSPNLEWAFHYQVIVKGTREAEQKIKYSCIVISCGLAV